ncbi:MAG: zinc ribbon domain-containing protein [Ruminococcaceae bacterium]|nr:zinc ribbon domain-containing protein [Oscillospiraceae bacterium]
MEKFFADLKGTMNEAVKKSGELVELTKTKLAVVETKGALRTKYELLGEVTYQAAKGEETSAEVLEELIASIDELRETLKQQELRVASISKKKICSVCGKTSEEGAAFCPACGQPFDAEE